MGDTRAIAIRQTPVAATSAQRLSRRSVVAADGPASSACPPIRRWRAVATWLRGRALGDAVPYARVGRVPADSGGRSQAAGWRWLNALGLMEARAIGFQPRRGGLLVSVERCFELGGWHVVAVAAEGGGVGTV